MKKTLALILATLMVFAFASCGTVSDNSTNTTAAASTTAEVTTAAAEVTTTAEQLRLEKIATYSAAILNNALVIPSTGIKVEVKSILTNMTMYMSENTVSISNGSTSFEILTTEAEIKIHMVTPSDAVGVYDESWLKAPNTGAEATELVSSFTDTSDTFDGLVSIDYLETVVQSGATLDHLSLHTDLGEEGSADIEIYVDVEKKQLVRAVQVSVGETALDSTTTTITLTDDIPAFTEPASETEYTTIGTEDFAMTMMGLIMLIAMGQ